MTHANVKAFHARLQSSRELQDRVLAIPAGPADQELEALVAIAGEVGTPFTAAEYLSSIGAGSAADEALTAEELEAVAGGTTVSGGTVLTEFRRQVETFRATYSAIGYG